MVNKLKRCPLCGGRAYLTQGVTGIRAIVCYCSSHVFYGCEKDGGKTARAWNKRAKGVE